MENLSSDELFAKGKKFYVTTNFNEALTYLAAACKQKSSETGDLHDDMFEFYYYYAKALYEFGKENDGLMVDDDKDKESNKNEVTPNKEQKSENGNVDIVEESKEKCEETNDKNIEEVNKSNEDKPESEKETSDQEDGDETLKDEDGKEALTENEDEASYLELAYETIECAKVILERQISKADESNLKELEMKMTDCLDVIGYINLELETVDDAVKYFTKALELREKYYPKSRITAESHLNIAQALNVDYKWDKGLDHLNLCIENLRDAQKCEEKDSQEFNDIESIIVEVKEKIEDAKSAQSEFQAYKKAMVDEVATTFSTKPVNNINNLVKRRAPVKETVESTKPDDDISNSNSEEPPKKRTKSD